MVVVVIGMVRATLRSLLEFSCVRMSPSPVTRSHSSLPNNGAMARKRWVLVKKGDSLIGVETTDVIDLFAVLRKLRLEVASWLQRCLQNKQTFDDGREREFGLICGFVSYVRRFLLLL